MAKVPENIGCDNMECVEGPNCHRKEIYQNKTAVEVKTFGGTKEKGCGKFLPRKEKQKD